MVVGGRQLEGCMVVGKGVYAEKLREAQRIELVRHQF